MRPRIVLGYAGGVGASWAVSRLTEAEGADVVTLTLDLGQGRDLEQIRDEALAAGAVRAHVLDAREEFARGYVLPALQAGVSQEEGRPPLAAALGQALIARKLVEIAAIEEATSIAHGGAGRDQERLDACLADLSPEATIVAAAHPAVPSNRTQANLWGAVRTVAAPSAKEPDTPAFLAISFERGVPTGVNGVPMALTELIESLTLIAGRHGVGRIRAAAGASKAPQGLVYEAPASVVLHAAHRELEAAVAPPELIRTMRDQAVTYAELVYSGRWFTDTREAFDAVNATVQQMVTGTVRVNLFRAELLSLSAKALGEEAVIHL